MRKPPWQAGSRRRGLVVLALLASAGLGAAWSLRPAEALETGRPDERAAAAARPAATAPIEATLPGTRPAAAKNPGDRPAAPVLEEKPGRPRVALCLLPASRKLPPQTLRGLAAHLDQYPTLSLASAAQRAAAERLLEEVRAAAEGWVDPRAAAADGFDTDRATRALGDRSVHYLHAEFPSQRLDGLPFDPGRPKAVIYANAPGRPLVLVGVMFAMKRGMQGPTPGGPITRWHWHRVCARGDERGVKPRADGSCPPGSRLQDGSEMMHVWFTNDLRSAFAIHAPEPELCAAGLLPADHCRTLSGSRGT